MSNPKCGPPPPPSSSPAASGDKLMEEPAQQPPKRLRTVSPLPCDGEDDTDELENGNDTLVPNLNDGDGDVSEVVEDGVAGLVARICKAGTSSRMRITAVEKRATFCEKWGDTSPKDVIRKCKGSGWT